MITDADNPNCASLAPDLAAYAWGKLGDERLAEVQSHVDQCASCSSELDDFREVKDAVALIPTISLTQDFSERLMVRVRGAKRVSRATPLVSPAAGSASRRLASMAERDRPVISWLRPRLKVITLVASAAAAALFLFISQMVEIETPTPKTAALREPHKPGRATVARWRQRRECESLIEAALDGDALDVSDILADGDMMMTASYDVSQHEKCVLLFAADDWDALRAAFSVAPAGPEKLRFAGMEAAGRAVSVAGGRLAVPGEFGSTYLEGGSDLVIMKLRGRTEIWSRRALEDHRRKLPQITVDMGDIGMVPVKPCERRG